MKKIAVIILNWNGIELLKKFIPNTISNSRQANIYVIDNFSEETPASSGIVYSKT